MGMYKGNRAVQGLGTAETPLGSQKESLQGPPPPRGHRSILRLPHLRRGAAPSGLGPGPGLTLHVHADGLDGRHAHAVLRLAVVAAALRARDALDAQRLVEHRRLLELVGRAARGLGPPHLAGGVVRQTRGPRPIPARSASPSPAPARPRPQPWPQPPPRCTLSPGARGADPGLTPKSGGRTFGEARA